MKELYTTVLTVIGSGAFFSFIQFIISRADTKRSLQKQIEDLSNKVDENSAVLARTHILRFADEQQSGIIKHSREYFAQTIADIDTYEKYCAKHPDFSNGLTVLASKYIKDEFVRLYKEGSANNEQ